MYLIIIFTVIPMLIGFVVGLDIDISEAFADAFLGGFIGAFIGFVLAILIGIFAPEPLSKEKHYLQNMQDNSSVHGTFFLGTGSINGSSVYSFYVKERTNSYTRKDINPNEAEVIIHYTNDPPYYTYSYRQYRGESFENWYIVPARNRRDSRYDFYIPRGSITSDYQLDAK